MEIMRTPMGRRSRRAGHLEVVDAELAGAWVVDVRRRPQPVRAGWLVECEDDIVLLTDSPDPASWPADPLDAA